MVGTAWYAAHSPLTTLEFAIKATIGFVWVRGKQVSESAWHLRPVGPKENAHAVMSCMLGAAAQWCAWRWSRMYTHLRSIVRHVCIFMLLYAIRTLCSPVCVHMNIVCVCVCVCACATSSQQIASHWIFYLIVLPLAILWTVLAHVPGPHAPIVADATLSLWFTLWCKLRRTHAFAYTIFNVCGQTGVSWHMRTAPLC